MLMGQMVQAGGGGFYPYTVDYSCRFNDDDSAYTTRTISTASDQQTFTISAWFKRCNIGTGTSQAICGAGTATTSRFSILLDTTVGKLRITDNTGGGGTLMLLEPSMLFCDPSAWYHLIVAVDTTIASPAADRVNVWVNGNLITDFITETYPSQNDSFSWNDNVEHRIGARPNGAAQYADMYMSQFVSIDGSQLDETSFGEDKNGIWVPKDVSGLTFGTEGFLLDFADSADLGNDVSGNNNDFTSSGLAANDQVTDTPTNNYAVMNSLVRWESGTQTYSEGNLKYVAGGPTSDYCNCCPTLLVPPTGKWYMEFTTIGSVGSSGYIGFVRESIPLFAEFLSSQRVVPGGDTDSYGYYLPDGTYRYNGSFTAYGSGTGATAGDVIGVAIDRDNDKVFISINNTWENSGDPEAGTNPMMSSALGDENVLVVATGYNHPTSGNQSYSADFGQLGFTYTPPTDFLPLCSANLPEPTIGPNSETKLSDVFVQGTYTGDGVAIGSGGNSINAEVDMTSGDWMVAIKNRDDANSWEVYDTVRGANEVIFFDDTNDGVTRTEGLCSFDSTGFTVGSHVAVNDSGEDYVWFAFKVTAGFFDIVQPTGTGVARTISHNLGVIPKLITSKAYDRGSVSNWPTYCETIPVTDPETDYLILNGTLAATDDSTFWNDTAPTASVFSVGTNVTNLSGVNSIVYLWADSDISKVFYYEGNGNADGPFVYTGNKPDFFFTKSSSYGGTFWLVADSERHPDNPVSNYLALDDPLAEVTYSWADLLSNGVKMRQTGDSLNRTGQDYIGVAIGQPDKYTRGR